VLVITAKQLTYRLVVLSLCFCCCHLNSAEYHKGGKTQHTDKDATESLVGRGRAMVTSSNSRTAHVSCDGRTSSKMRGGAMRI
jgi:hypothetical protein